MPTAREHESAAVAQIRAVIKQLEDACTDAGHGNYGDAFKAVRAARDAIYFAEVELLKAGRAMKRTEEKKP